MGLFVQQWFTGNSGLELPWKIECDALTDDDIATLAFMLIEVIPPFGEVEGVPRGGLRIADALQQYVTEGPLLIVDDVLTTGGSMERQRAGRDAIGAVLFARGWTMDWVTPLFTMTQPWKPPIHVIEAGEEVDG